MGHGELLGKGQPVILHLLDIDTATEPLNGLKLELIDSALPQLTGESSHTSLRRSIKTLLGRSIWTASDADVIATTNPTEACTGVSIAIMVGGFPRKAHMERRDIMAMNGSIYSKHAYALEKYACKDCKVSNV